MNNDQDDERAAAYEAPVYDERGNARPRGTAGARPMTFEDRVEITQRLQAEHVERLTNPQRADTATIEEPQQQ